MQHEGSSAHSIRQRVKTRLAELRARLFDVYGAASYSQEGEDRILGRLFEEKAQGFYVDVGAHHPRRYSNTYAFYRRGWSGINIEPNSALMHLFARERPRDCNLQLGIAECSGSLVYHEFDDPALNTFDDKLADWRIHNTRYRVVSSRKVRVEPLADVLRRHLPVGQRIDFLSVDVEGLDLAVLRSNDWQQFRPTCVLAESLGATLEAVAASAPAEFMRSQGYELYAKTVSTIFYRDSKVPPR